MLLPYTITHVRECADSSASGDATGICVSHWFSSLENGSENFPACPLTCKGAGFSSSFPKAARNVTQEKKTARVTSRRFLQSVLYSFIPRCLFLLRCSHRTGRSSKHNGLLSLSEEEDLEVI